MAEDRLAEFWSLIGRIGTCMMTTRDSNALRARPMMPDIERATHEFRFLTRQSTHKIEELAANPDVNLAFSDPQQGTFVSVSGQAYLTQDRKLIDELWSPEAEAYFGCNKDNPDIAVIRVVPSIAEYWDSRGALRQTWNVFKGKVAEPVLRPVRSRKVALR
jgi:general stress protein 26